MSNSPLTLDEFRRQHAGYVAVVPDVGISHIVTRPREISQSFPPSPGYPNGRTIRHIGPETLEVLTTADGVRVVRLRSAADFNQLCGGGNGLLWENANLELRLQIAAESKNRAGPC